MRLRSTLFLCLSGMMVFGCADEAAEEANLAPVITDQEFRLNENSAAGAIVGKVQAKDPENAPLQYSITSQTPAGGAFAIDAATGEVSVANAALLDFETNPTFTLSVKVDDKHSKKPLSSSSTITVKLDNVSESIVISEQQFSIGENSANGTLVGQVQAQDPDNGTLQYSITSQTPAGAFAINASTGALSVANAALLDFETNPTFTLTVKAEKQSSGTPMSSTATVVVGLTNVNENVTIANQNFRVNENTANGTQVGQVQANDPENAPLRYSITSQTPAGAFAINASTGALSVANAALLDFETNPTFTLSVKVEEQSNSSMNSTASVVVSLNNVDELFTLEIRPDAASGKDATLTSYFPNNNYGSHPQILASAWTNNTDPANLRSLFDFDMSSIPAAARIETANLYLYHHETGNTGHSGTNEAVIKRVTQNWTENTVTWATQPTTTTTNQVTVPASTSATQNYVINLKPLVLDTRANATSSFGYLFQQKTETAYRSLVFGSSDLTDVAKRPKLVITYIH